VAKAYANDRIDLATGEAHKSPLRLLAALRGGRQRLQGTRPPMIAGPDAHSVLAGPPTFHIDPGDNPFWVAEVATRAELFHTAANGNRRDPSNFYATDADLPGFLTGSSWTLPAAAWERLRGSQALYYRVWTSSSGSDWIDWRSSTPDPRSADAPLVRLVTAAAPPNDDLRALLTYLHLDAGEFARAQGRYFQRLEDLLAAAGSDPGEPLDQDNFREAVRAYQRRAGLVADGIPGQETLWELQSGAAHSRDQELYTAEADVWLPPGASAWDPEQHGYDSVQLRGDAIGHYDQLRDEVLAAGAVLTSAGSFRDVRAPLTPGRTATSMHHAGLAFDLSTTTGMQDPDVDPYIVTRHGDRWRVWARASGGGTRDLDAVVWRDGATTSRRVTATVVDFTAVAERNGFAPIRPRSRFPSNYFCAEWWHFQCDSLLVGGINQFGAELLALARYDEADLRAVASIWANRKLIFRRSWF
jgi:putative peptidoglycan binding protein